MIHDKQKFLITKSNFTCKENSSSSHLLIHLSDKKNLLYFFLPNLEILFDTFHKITEHFEFKVEKVEFILQHCRPYGWYMNTTVIKSIALFLFLHECYGIGVKHHNASYFANTKRTGRVSLSGVNNGRLKGLLNGRTNDKPLTYHPTERTL